MSADELAARRPPASRAPQLLDPDGVPVATDFDSFTEALEAAHSTLGMLSDHDRLLVTTAEIDFAVRRIRGVLEGCLDEVHRLEGLR